VSFAGRLATVIRKRLEPSATVQLRGVEERWEALASADPMWAILTQRGREGGAWDAASFFATGREQVSDVLARLDDIGARPPQRRALDFGCGIGRVTQALCDHFDEVVGVDVAPTMVEIAEMFNRRRESCEYVLNTRTDLSAFSDASFDLVYSTLVLQHLPPTLSELYVGEFIRVLRSDGLAVFQMPTARRGGHVRAGRIRRRVRRRVKTGLEMYPVPRSTVESWIDAAGGQLIAAFDSPPNEAHHGLLYVVARASPMGRMEHDGNGIRYRRTSHDG
jgi:ubiquinone/menaquinone biosynthesis C-methylase UbiE